MNSARRASPRLEQWLAETHSSGFELCRHFFWRFFDSEFVSVPGQGKTIAGGLAAMLVSLGLMMWQAYYHKYRVLGALDDPRPFRLALLADNLFIIVLAMIAIGLLTAIEWPALFPSLRDYLALASLPLRMRDLFAAKFAALLVAISLAAVAATLVPSGVLGAVIEHGPAPNLDLQPLASFASSSLAALFVFFALAGVQGALLNLVPVRQFPRVSLWAQGILLSVFLCTVPFVLSIPGLHNFMSLRPGWSVYAPPLWFLGLDQVMIGNFEPLAVRLAWLSAAGLTGAAALCILGYIWSYRRHRKRLLESTVENTARVRVPSAMSERLLRDVRAFGVFAFIAKSLGRSRQHRLILTAFAAIGLAAVCEGFASLILGGAGLSRHTAAFRQAIIAVPLAFSLFTLAGLRYLFRLPVEIRANWIFRIHEPGNAAEMLAGVDAFVLYWGAVPVALLTLPVEMYWLGPSKGAMASFLCLLPALILMEALLFQFDKIPFTSSYLPGRRPLVDTVVIYLIAAALYVGGIGSLIRVSLESPYWAAGLAAALAALWWIVRRERLSSRVIHRLEYDEIPEPVVQLLSIERD
ncbi:MAG TPA: hypothetical protein VFW83_06565 [Bryobacteraceae bacterium]|nr:hypothetical protein [Bryobacteraceae bacterium]